MRRKQSIQIQVSTSLLIIFALLVANLPQTALAEDSGVVTAPLLLGIYPQGWIDQTTIDNELTALNNWAGKRASLAGVSLDIQETNVSSVLPLQLNALWNNGYTAFINLVAGTISTTKPTAYQIAAGNYDAALNAWAQAFAAWSAGGKWAFIAPLPEMNVPWSSYGMDAGNYILAYNRIRQIFTQNNVPSSAVRWVWAPNAWYGNSFTEYYPGNAQVDVVAFSAYNFGNCTGTSSWKTPEQLFGPYIIQMRTLAAEKPIFISRAATSAVVTSYSDANAKNDWLDSTYNYLASQIYVRAVLYYNITSDCDWAIYKLNKLQYDGYPWGVSNSGFDYVAPADLGQMSLAPTLRKTYIPAVLSRYPLSSVGDVIVSGVYPQGWPGLQTTIDTELRAIDFWAGKRISLVGTFIGIIDPNYTANVKGQLETLWNNGFTPFVNLMSNSSASAIASGNLDSYLRSWAQAYAQYATGGGGRVAYIAPLPEMNGNWTPYSSSSATFKQAYNRIQQIFAQNGVPAGSVRWVFAPNSESSSGMEPFESYYPGDAVTNAVSFSSYNFGYNPNNPWPDWSTPDEAFGPFLARMSTMAPGKPIFVSQTGTTGYTSTGYSVSAKNTWLQSAMSYLANYPNVRAFLYFNINSSDGYDWPFYVKNDPTRQFTGYVQGIAHPKFTYLAPADIKTLWR